MYHFSHGIILSFLFTSQTYLEIAVSLEWPSLLNDILWLKTLFEITLPCNWKKHESTLSKCVWEVKRKLKIIPPLKWYIIKSVPAYSSISKKCQLCLQEKFEILNFPNPNELLNKRSELISKCHHVNKFLLSTYKSND